MSTRRLVHVTIPLAQAAQPPVIREPLGQGDRDGDTAFNFTVMKDDLTALAQKFGSDPNVAMSFSGGLPWIVADFVFGLLIVWTYAAMRPRFGPGPKTALMAGGVLVIGTTVLLWAFTASLGMMPMSSLVKGAATSVVSIALGSLVGGWAYREDEGPGAAVARAV